MEAVTFFVSGDCGVFRCVLVSVVEVDMKGGLEGESTKKR